MGEENRQLVPGMLEKRIADVHLTEVRSLLSLQKLVEDLVREQTTPDQDEVDVELQQQYRKELRQKLKMMPPREIAYIIESLEPNERLVVWNE
ncbi:MAG TPA: magnesium transporter CorA, partial [Accumulibacter sp.]|nr:magnesium transporter CorA [Accumulibacter sp.]